MKTQLKPKKRKVSDEPIILDKNFLPNLLETIQKVKWPYKNNTQQLWQRDQALTSFLVLTGVRNSETQLIKKKQTRIYKTHILVVNIKTVKNGKLRKEIILPKKGSLAQFTEIFETWLKQVPEEENILFPQASAEGYLNWNKPLSTQRIHWIIKTTTNMFPHWLRGVHATLHAQKIFDNDPWALKEHMGWQSFNSSAAYVDPQMKKYLKNIYKLK